MFFRAVFCTEQLCCSCRMVFRMFLAFLIFDPNWPFCKGYSLCMGSSPCKMADFQNYIISPIFGVFSSRLLHSTTLFLCRMVFRMFLAFLIFDPNWPFCKGYSLFMGYSPCKMADFQKYIISPIFGVFSRRFLHRTTLLLLLNCFSHVLRFLIFDPNWPFCKGYSLCMGYSTCKMADFQIYLISPIFGVFWSRFLHKTTLLLLWNGFSHVFGIFNFWPKLTIF